MAKLQRWVDLLAALLRRHAPVTLEELKRDVPEYLGKANLAALRRTFERDKVELREFGIPIITVTDSNDDVVGYQLRRDAFYLPYLSLMQDAHRKSTPRRVDVYGYRALPDLAFEADELDAVVEAARRVQQLGDPTLAALARSAVRKLAFDLPVDAGVQEPRAMYLSVAQPPAGEILQALDEALRQKKHVTIDYHTIGSDTRRERVVSPFGLFFLNSHWYLAAKEDPAGPVKNFRMSRVSAAAVNTVRPGTPDSRCHPTSASRRTPRRGRRGNWVTQVASRRWWSSAVPAARRWPPGAWARQCPTRRRGGGSRCGGWSRSPGGCCRLPVKWYRCLPPR